MRGWVAVVGADDDFQLAEYPASFFLVLAQHREAADAFAVQAEALGERGGDKEVHARGHELADYRAVLLDAVAKALVGHVEEGGEFAGLEHFDDLVPLRGGDVVARGVVAAGVQHDDGAWGGSLQAGEHAVEVDATFFSVVVGIAADFETGVGEQGAVVFPARIRDEHLGIRAELLQEVGADLQAAGAANGLHGGHAAAFHGLAVRPEHQCLNGIVVCHDAVDRQVAARRGLGHHLLLGRLHALQERKFAVVVEVHADA